jgi:hypothetical protein
MAQDLATNQKETITLTAKHALALDPDKNLTLTLEQA